MNLNVASGLHPTVLPGWVNIDLPWDGVKRPTVYGDAFRLPFRDRVFGRAYVGHFLEHLWREQIGAFVAELSRVMVPGGEVMVVGPDIAKAVETGQPVSILRAIIGDEQGRPLGSQLDGPGAHKWVATEALTVRAMTDAGLTDVRPVDVADVVPPVWPNVSQAPWQCAVTARVDHRTKEPA